MDCVAILQTEVPPFSYLHLKITNLMSLEVPASWKLRQTKLRTVFEFAPVVIFKFGVAVIHHTIIIMAVLQNVSERRPKLNLSEL